MYSADSTCHHKTALIDPGASIGSEVEIGPYSIIERGVTIGNKCRISSHVLVGEGAELDSECQVFNGAVVGTIPQDLKFGGESSVLKVGARTVIREYSTLNRGTRHGGFQTAVGSDCLLMAYSHVAHDCRLGDNVILSNAVNMGGHVEMDDWVTIGGMTAIHQFVKIGRHAFVGGMARVTKDVPPFILTSGEPLKYYGLNSTGLLRRGFTEARLSAIKKAYRFIYRSDLKLQHAVDAIRSELEINPDIQSILDFIEKSERGLIGR